MISSALGVSVDTLEKRLRKLKKQKMIVFIGSPKTGGYYIVKTAGKK
jgi:predicted HTH transcriptional regulator